MIPVSADVREKAGVKGGDIVDVEIELDTQPREVILSADLKRALNENAKAKKFFDALSYSKQKAYVKKN